MADLQPDERVTAAVRTGEICEDRFTIGGSRWHLAYMVLASELDWLVYAPWWTRRKIIKRIKAQTKFDNDTGTTLQEPPQ